MHYLFIDGSYWVFFRYYAIMRWMSLAHKEVEIPDPYKNKLFRDKFIATFISKLDLIKEKLDIDDSNIIVAKDCSRKQIWRNAMYDKYKATRDKDDSFMGGPFFALAYDHIDISGNETEGLFKIAGVTKFMEHPHLEADDCIALAVNKFIKGTENTCTIITGDLDYLQLNYENVNLMTLKMKPLATEKNSVGDPKKDLMLKIILGDKSDNIESVFKRCGKKTALKMLEDTTIFLKKIKDDDAMRRFKRNQKLIDFTEIPKYLCDEFYGSLTIDFD
mgnify:CR=1 FL=1